MPAIYNCPMPDLTDNCRFVEQFHTVNKAYNFKIIQIYMN